MRAWLRYLALGLVLTAMIPAAAALAAGSAEEVLLDKANYWRLKDRPDLAAEALNQLLEINPNQPDALFQYGMLEMQQNKTADAQRYLAKLQQVAPNSPHIADLQGAIRTGQIGPNDLGEARRLAQAGQMTEAVQKYQQIFKGPPPSSFGIEYYMTLGGTPQGWDEARQGLERLSQNSPNDAQIKLALAELYTYREPTRMDGIAILAQLSKNPVVGADAVKAWRQALTWLGGNPQSKAAYQQYLAQFPDDPDIRQLLADLAKQPMGGPGNEAQSKAYADLKRGNLAAAERQFAGDLRANPNDPQALGGLGLVRLRQERFGEARDLLGRAMKAGPDQKTDLAAAYDSALFWSRVQEAKALAARKNYAAAAAILNGLHSRTDNWGADLVLADVESKLNHNPAAEAAYRRALRGRPGNADAMLGLASVLKAEGKTAEADAIAARLTPAQRAKLAGGPGNKGEKLRSEAKEADADGNKPLATAKFQEAIAADPKNPWIRLDYARFLAGQNQMIQAAATIDPAASGGSPTSYLVAGMYQMYQDRWGDALAYADRVPAAQRTTDLNNFRDRVLVQGTVAQAKDKAKAGDAAGARAMLVNLYNDPKVQWDSKRLLAYSLFKLGDRDAALQMTRDAGARGGPGANKALIDYASLLLSMHREDEASAVVAQLNARGNLTADDRDALMPTEAYVAARQADKLREHGDYAGAYDQIAPLLAQKPDDTTLLLCLGRIYASSGREKEALDNFDKAYQQEPSDPDVLRGAVEGAILAHAFGPAEDYVDKGMESDPQNPRLFYLRAQIARAKGDNAAAIHDLQTARALRGQQTGASTDTSAPAPASPPTPASVPAATGAPKPTGVPTPTSTPAPVAPAVPPPPSQPANPFRSSQARPVAWWRFDFSLIGSAAAAESAAPNPIVPPAALSSPVLVVQSADSDDLIVPPPQPRRVAAIASASGTDRVPMGSGTLTAASAAKPGPGSTQVQIAQVELQPPPPIGFYQAPVTPMPSAAPDTGDSLDLDIERSLASIEAESNPTLQAGFGVRVRDGASGLSLMTETGIPIIASFSPWYTGTAKVWVTPVNLESGTLSSDNLAEFGTNALTIAQGGVGVNPGDQSASGVGLMAGYAYGPYSGTFGTSPMGFAVTNWLGSLAYAPKFWNNTLTVRVEGIRQPVTDTILSYAGTHASLTAANAASAGAFGNKPTWGGVTKNGAHAQVYYDNREWGAYAGAGLSLLVGTQVPENDETEAFAGAYFRPWKWDNNVVRVGAAVAYLGYTRNLGGFTFGQGGYFSPRNYEALTFPVEYTGHTGNWSYLAAVAAGIQHFNQSGSVFYPSNPSAQAALDALDPNNSSLAGKTATGPAFNLHGQVEYALSDSFAVGAAASFDNGRDYNEGIAKIYLRKTFDWTGTPAAVLPTSSNLGFHDQRQSSM